MFSASRRISARSSGDAGPMVRSRNRIAPARRPRAAHFSSTNKFIEIYRACRFALGDDLKAEQVLAEPTVAQPVFLTFDERGRLWVVQYLQYPFPAGLKILSEDKHLRATYDKVPPPPPKHFKGLDKITIHEDTNGDGV